MFEKIFNEIFGDIDWDEVLNKMSEEKEDNENNESYYHKVVDEYENGHQVSHIEKEIKDGKVIKDVNETFKIEVKGEEEPQDKKIEVKEEQSNDKNDEVEYYKDKLKLATKVLEKQRNEILDQQERIEDYKKRCEDLESKIEVVSNFLKS